MLAREDRGEVAVLRMAHGKVSALDAEFCAVMAAELERLERDATCAVVLTGTDSAFSAGVDLFRILDGGVEYVRRFLPLMERFLRTLLVFPKPLVAAINGHAIAGGCIMAAAADYRVMATGSARIGVPELAVGVPFPSLPFEIVRSRLSPAVVRSLIYSGRTVHAAEALLVGLVDEAASADQVVQRSVTVAEEYGAIPARTFALTKRAFTQPVLERVERAAAINDEAIGLWQTPDVHEAIRRYLDKTIKSGRTTSGSTRG